MFSIRGIALAQGTRDAHARARLLDQRTEGMDEMIAPSEEPSRGTPHDPSIDLLGHSQKMAEVRELIDRVAGTDATVLIRGESGTGKERVARALGAGSPRRDRAFVKVIAVGGSVAG